MAKGARGARGALVTDKKLMTRLWTIRETGASATALNLGGKGADPWSAGRTPRSIRCGLGRLPARVPGARRSLRLPHLALRALRRRLHPRAHQLRLRTRAGLAHWRRFLTEAARPRRSSTAARSRASTATARRRASCCRSCSAPELMQAFREFKALWDPQNRMNPGQAHRRATARREPAPRARIQAVQLKTRFRSERRSAMVSSARPSTASAWASAAPRAAARCARATAPRARSATPRAAARACSRDAARRGHHRRLGERRGEGSARLVPRLQGLPQRLPDAHRHGGLQGRVPVALLRDAPPPAPGVVDGTHRRVGAARSPVLGIANDLLATRFAKRSPALRRSERLPKFAPRTFRSQFKPNGRRRAGRAVRRHVQQPLPPETAAAAQKCSSARAARSSCRRGASAAAARTTTTACSMRRSARSSACSKVLGPRLDAGVPVVVLEPGCLSVFRDELRQLFPDDPRAARSRRRPCRFPNS